LLATHKKKVELEKSVTVSVTVFLFNLGLPQPKAKHLSLQEKKQFVLRKSETELTLTQYHIYNPDTVFNK